MAGQHGPGFHPHLPGFTHKFLATTLGATMWFFIFYRARYVHPLVHHLEWPFIICCRKDGAKLLGLKHPWEGHEHDHHGHEAGHSEHH
ncbi:hypothetical protein C8T65DRAFT_611860 [Cerioporus squamosus]|nr:hypothetical protein C8T65DRAFT_611860 [Cerioporus squamosus]